MPTTKIIPGFDVLKFAMALVVVNIHAKLIIIADGYTYVQNGWSFINDIAVPVFFVLSSYFLFRKQSSTESVRGGQLTRYIIRLLKLYGFWCIVLSPVILKMWHKEYLEVPFYESIYLFFKNTLFAFQFGASWFLGALLMGVPIIWYLYKILGDKFLWIIPFAVYIYIYIPSDDKVVYEWYEDNLRYPTTSFPAGLLWITIGHYLSHPKIMALVNRISRKWIIAIFLIMMVMSTLFPEYRYLFIIPAVIQLIAFAYNMPHGGRIWKKWMRPYSTLFYCPHYSLIIVFIAIAPFYKDHVLLLYITVLFCLTIMSTVIFKLKDKRNFSWLKYSY